MSLFITTSALAEPMICVDPVTAVCSNPMPLPKYGLSQKVSQQAASEVNKLLNEKLPVDRYATILRDAVANPENIGLKKTKRMLLRTMLYMHCAEKIAQGYFSGERVENCFPENLGSPRNITFKNIFALIDATPRTKKVDSVLSSVVDLVRLTVERGSLDSDLRSSLMASIENTKWVGNLEDLKSTYLEFSEKQLVEADGPLQSAFGYCDFNLVDANALNISTNDVGKRTVVICPSAWIRAMDRHLDVPEESMILSLTHEFGHSLENCVANSADNSAGGKIYESTLSCLTASQVNPGKLRAKLPGKRGDSSRLRFLKNKDFNVRAKTANLFYSEYSADVVATKALSIYLQKVSPEKRVPVFIENLQQFCGDKVPETISSSQLKRNFLHPAGEYRIREIYLNSPEIRNALGCESQSVQNTCSLF